MSGSNPIRQITLLHTGALGDFVLALHVVAAARRRFPAARTEAIVRCPLAAWAVAHHLLDVAHDADRTLPGWLYSDVRPGQRDTLTQILESSDLVLSFLGGGDEVRGRLQATSRGQVVCLPPQPSGDTLRTGRHIVSQWCQQIASMGWTLQPADQPLVPALPEADCRYDLIVHPGSGGTAKCCPLVVLQQAVQACRRRGLTVAWMIGPVEQDRYGSQLAESLEPLAPVICEDVSPAADTLRRARVFVGNDAGMAHVAAACGLQTITLFGPTDPRIWRPVGPAVTVIHADFDAVGTEPATLVTRLVRAVTG
jgi:hypothetical protein